MRCWPYHKTRSTSNPVGIHNAIGCTHTEVRPEGPGTGRQGRPVVVDNAPIPKLSPGDNLVKTLMVAPNPFDYKMPGASPSKGAVMGNEFVFNGVLCSLRTPSGSRNGFLLSGSRASLYVSIIIAKPSNMDDLSHPYLAI